MEIKIDLDEYISLLGLTYTVAHALKGKQSEDNKWFDCQKLTLKIISHSATIYYLRMNGTQILIPSHELSWHFHDFASTAVVTRAAFESYLKLYEVFFEPKTEDEFEFVHTLWQLSGFIIRENWVPNNEELGPEFVNAQIEINDLKNRIRKTNKFKSFTDNQKKEILKGRSFRRRDEIAKAAGFGGMHFNKVYDYYSSFTHGDGLSGAQIMTAEDANTQLDFMDGQMLLILTVLSKIIINYTNTFEESRSISDNNPELYFRAQIWDKAAENMQ
ncbi:MAG: hypothetical protein ACYC0V_03120 [Armatimonadota bacterium]